MRFPTLRAAAVALTAFAAVMDATPVKSQAWLYALPERPQSVRMACGKRDAIVEQLEAKYGETRGSYGLSQGKGVVEVYSNTETGSWTVLITNAQGTACVMAAGEGWRDDAARKSSGQAL